MKRFILLVIATLVACEDSKKKVETPAGNEWDLEGWELIWNDEFKNSELNLDKWSYEIGGHGWGNNELQFYTDNDSTAFIEDGNLVLRAKVVPQGTGSPDNLRYFTSARLRTSGKGDWRYGRIEVKAKMALGQGIWPAIWMLPTDWMYGGWPQSGEIDIMEYDYYRKDKIHTTVHMANENGDPVYFTSIKNNISNVSEEFHVYSLEWTSNELIFLIDNIIVYSFNIRLCF